MAYRRRTIRKPRRAMRSTRRRMMARIPRAPRPAMLTVKLNRVVGTIGHAGATWTAYPFQFRVGNLPQYSSYQALFDAYRLNAVKITFTPFNDSLDRGSTVTTAGLSMPRLYTLIDRNGIAAGTIATENQFLEYGSSKQIKNPLKPFSIYIKAPGNESSVDVSGVNVPALTTYKRWIDTNTGTADFNGCAVGWIAPNAVSTWYYHVVETYYVQFKNIH